MRRVVLIGSGPLESRYIEQIAQRRQARLTPEQNAEFIAAIATLESIAEADVPDIEEIIDPAWRPDEAARNLAKQKAEVVSGKYPADCVIAADTIVAAEGQILGKPADEEDAARMLRILSGREHKVITGVCLTLNGESRVFSQGTRVKFYPLRDEEIWAYIKTGEPMDKAGAYGIQGRGGLLVEGIAGDYFNVVGLPIARLVRELDALCTSI